MGLKIKLKEWGSTLYIYKKQQNMTHLDFDGKNYKLTLEILFFFYHSVSNIWAIHVSVPNFILFSFSISLFWYIREKFIEKYWGERKYFNDYILSTKKLIFMLKLLKRSSTEEMFSYNHVGKGRLRSVKYFYLLMFLSILMVFQGLRMSLSVFRCF